MPSNARSARISSSIRKIASARKWSSQSCSGRAAQCVPNASTLAFPTSIRYSPGIKPFRDVADLFTKRFAVAQVGRTCQHIDLSARIVDVIFAGHVEPSLLQQRRQRVANHGAAAMTDMHRPSRIGGYEFDIDLAAVADVAIAVARSGAENFAQPLVPERVRQRQVDKARGRRPRPWRHRDRRGIFRPAIPPGRAASCSPASPGPAPRWPKCRRASPRAAARRSTPGSRGRRAICLQRQGLAGYRHIYFPRNN